ncbi:MAG: caspase family protein, partial [Spirochaetales bacterium]|nr:caspase family protein [Spirochaetales bacterium]
AQKVFGVPESHLVALYDSEATGGNIKGKLKKLLNEGIAPGDTLYFYYNGHGVPNPTQGSAPYMLPTDMDLDYIAEEPFFDLRNLYTLFQESKAGKVIVFMDSCFTGKTDGRSVYQGKAAPRLSPKKIDVSSNGNLAVLSAGTETQFSSAWPEKGHRLFTYHLIEALASGVNSVDTLFSETSQSVSQTSREIGGALSFQDPTMQGNGGIEW